MTTQVNTTIKTALDQANPSQLADLLRQMKLGTMTAPLKRTFTALTAASTFDLTLIDGAGESPASVLNPNRKAALLITALQVTASGTAASLGAYTAAVAAATPIVPPGGAGLAVGVATISDDGKTITFPNTVTAFTVIYMPRPSVDMNADFPATGVG
jgi:hypothetical protein